MAGGVGRLHGDLNRATLVGREVDASGGAGGDPGAIGNAVADEESLGAGYGIDGGEVDLMADPLERDGRDGVVDADGSRGGDGAHAGAIAPLADADLDVVVAFECHDGLRNLEVGRLLPDRPEAASEAPRVVELDLVEAGDHGLHVELERGNEQVEVDRLTELLGAVKHGAAGGVGRLDEALASNGRGEGHDEAAGGNGRGEREVGKDGEHLVAVDRGKGALGEDDAEAGDVGDGDGLQERAGEGGQDGAEERREKTGEVGNLGGLEEFAVPGLDAGEGRREVAEEDEDLVVGRDIEAQRYRKVGVEREDADVALFDEGVEVEVEVVQVEREERVVNGDGAVCGRDGGAGAEGDGRSLLGTELDGDGAVSAAGQVAEARKQGCEQAGRDLGDGVGANREAEDARVVCAPTCEVEDLLVDADAEREGLAGGGRVGVDGARRGHAVDRRRVAVGDAGAGLDGGHADLAGEVEAGGSALGRTSATRVVGEVEGVAKASFEAGRDGGERCAEVDGARGAEVDGAAGRGAREVAGAGVAGGAGGAAVVSAALGAERGVERIGDGAGELAGDEALHERHDGADEAAEPSAGDPDAERVGSDDELVAGDRDGDLLAWRRAHVELDDRRDRQGVGGEFDRAGRPDDAQREAVVEAEADVGDDLVRGAALDVDLGGVDADLELAALGAVVADVAALPADSGVADDRNGDGRRRKAEGDSA